MATPIPSNCASFSFEEVAKITRGTLVGPRNLGDSQECVTGVFIDSRAVVPGSAFIALRGERLDGHAFVTSAAARGASLVVVQRGSGWSEQGPAVVEVDDTRVAFGELAHAHLQAWRQGSDRRILVVTGSAGKTTTRSLLASLLATCGRCHATEGNLNNLVGLPAVALAVTGEHRFVVLEAGMSLRGEIAELSSIARPDVGVVTNIGVAHAAGVGGTRADVAREKGALFAALGVEAIGVANADDDACMAQAAHVRNRVTFGRSPASDYRLLSRIPMVGGSSVRVSRPSGTFAVRIPLIGEATALDFVAALASAEAAVGEPLDVASITDALSHTGAVGGRAEVLRVAGNLLIVNDSYNANPASMASALETLAELAVLEGRRAVAVLGEMKELGELAEAEHVRVGELVARAGVAVCVGCGGWIDRALLRAEELGVSVVRTEGVQDAAARVVGLVRPGDVVLVKASRSVGVEHVVEELLRTAGNN